MQPLLRLWISAPEAVETGLAVADGGSVHGYSIAMGLYLLHLHLHGLFRAQQLELGRDPDTGGQTTYVLELAQALAACPELDRLEVVTRLIQDRRISPD